MDMDGDSSYIEHAKAEWERNNWTERKILWQQTKAMPEGAMIRAQLILIRDEGPTRPEAEKFYRDVIEDHSETYFVRGHSALALSSSESEEAVFYLAEKMGRDSKNFDSSPYVRAMCAQALGRNALFIDGLPEAEKARICLILRKALDDDEPIVVENSIFALGQLHDHKATGDMFAATMSKLTDFNRATGEKKTSWETLALAFCEMGCTETFAILSYVKVLEESLDRMVAEKVGGAVDDLLLHSDFDGKIRLAAALKLFQRKAAFSNLVRMDGDEMRPDSVIGAVFQRPSFAPPERKSAPPTAPIRLCLKKA